MRASFVNFPPWAFALAISLAISIASCSSQRYTYVPQPNLEAASRDVRGVTYPIYAGPKEGSVRLMSRGLTDLKAKKDAPSTRALHLRMTVQNTEQKGDWKVNVNDQLVSFPSIGKSRPAYVDTNVQGLPEITIPAGQTRVIDLYYPLPKDLAKASRIPEFSLDWQVETTDRKISERTQFDRLTVNDVPMVYPYAPYPYDYDYGPGWGPNWWYNPYYSSLGFGFAPPL